MMGMNMMGVVVTLGDSAIWTSDVLNHLSDDATSLPEEYPCKHFLKGQPFSFAHVLVWRRLWV